VSAVAAGILDATIAVAGHLFEFGVPVWLICCHQPRRHGFALRLAVAILFLALGCSGLIALWTVTSEIPEDSMVPYVWNLIAYALLIPAFAAAVLFCFDTSAWNALFAVTAGYTIQNLASGAEETCRIAAVAHGAAAPPLWAEVVLTPIAEAIILAIAYVLFIGRVQDEPPLRRSSGTMLGMAVAVILLVIANDVVIRGMERMEAVPLPFLLSLRITHLAVCIFILYTEYQTLYKVRLEAGMEMARKLAEERSRQYAQSTATVQAINARMHDIRHKVMATLRDEGVGMSQTAAQELVHDINVYDAQVHTGSTALDCVLTEKSLICQREGIALTCMADGSMLKFMPEEDVYGLFSLLIDAGRDAAQTLPAKDSKALSLTATRHGSLAAIHLMGSSSASAEKPLLSATEQLGSMVKRHGGTAAATIEGSTFSVDILLPLKETD
jgi:hypothetical protein